MTTINRNRDNAGECHTKGAGLLMTSDEVYAMCFAREGVQEITDECAATIASWWHSASGDGAIFSCLSHRTRTVPVESLLDAIYREQRVIEATPYDYNVSDSLALNMLSTWAINGPGDSL